VKLAYPLCREKVGAERRLRWRRLDGRIRTTRIGTGRRHAGDALIALSTMAATVGSVCASLDPLLPVEVHVMAAERLHADDATVPVLDKGKTDTGRCWI